jgi:hypothetical protein
MCSKDDAQEADTTWTTPPVESTDRTPLMKANPSTAIDNTLDQRQNIDATARKQQAEQDQFQRNQLRLKLAKEETLKQAVEAKVETVVETTNSNTSAPSQTDKEKFNRFEGNKNVADWRMSVPRSVEIQELLRLLNEFKGYANTRYPKTPETVYVDKIVMAIRGCSSVVKSRQQAALDAGVVGPLVEVLTGVHLKDRETCLRTTQCIMGICGKNEVATAAFQAAGVVAAMAAVMNQHKGSKNTKDFEKAAAMFAEDQVAKAKAVATAAAAAKAKAQQQKEQREATAAAAAKAKAQQEQQQKEQQEATAAAAAKAKAQKEQQQKEEQEAIAAAAAAKAQQEQEQKATVAAAAATKATQETKQEAPQTVEAEVAEAEEDTTTEDTTEDTTEEPEKTTTDDAEAKKPQNTPSKKKRNRKKKRKKKN